MSRVLIFSGVLAVVLALLFGLGGQQKAYALPEYAAQTGEPCASCHVSPSGGGSRTVRGQAWVGNGKPGTVPDTLEALDLLGIDLQIDPAQFTTVPAQIPAAQPLRVQPGKLQELHPWLSSFNGN